MFSMPCGQRSGSLQSCDVQYQDLVTGEVSSTKTWRAVYFAIWQPNVSEILSKYFTKFFLDSNGIYE